MKPTRLFGFAGTTSTRRGRSDTRRGIGALRAPFDTRAISWIDPAAGTERRVVGRAVIAADMFRADPAQAFSSGR
jgi:hypothetical protein